MKIKQLVNAFYCGRTWCKATRVILERSTFSCSAFQENMGFVYSGWGTMLKAIFEASCFKMNFNQVHFANVNGNQRSIS